MNDGITSCIDVLRSVLAHLDQKGKKLLHLDSDDLASSLTPYSKALGFTSAACLWKIANASEN